MDVSLTLSKKRKRLLLIILIIAGTSIYALPYLKFTYYTPFQEALGLIGNNKAYGDLSSIYGIVNFVCYLPGGWMADRFSTRKLVVFSLLSTGALGIWLATYPSYWIVFFIFGAMGITTVLTFWAVYIKIVNLMSTSDEQGEAFGWLEGGGGILGLIINVGGLWLYQALGGTANDLRVVIIGISLLCILAGILFYIFLPVEIDQAKDDSGAVTAKLIIKVLMKPTTWLVGAIVFGTFVFVTGSSYLTPYLEVAFGLSAAVAGTVSGLRSEAIRIAAGPVFGNQSKRQGKSTVVIRNSFLALAILTASLLIIPTKAAFLYVMIVVVVAFGFFNFGIRGIYWAVIDELETPKYMVGTVVGVASIIGFIPDAFIYSLFGSIIDNNEGILGFRIIFVIFLITALLAAFVSVIADRKVKKIQNKGQIEKPTS